jgi:hypothetical protein
MLGLLRWCRRITEQRAEHDTLASQHAELQQSLAVSHAGHLALQQHHQEQKQAWQAQQQQMEQQQKQQLEALQKVLPDLLSFQQAHNLASLPQDFKPGSGSPTLTCALWLVCCVQELAASSAAAAALVESSRQGLSHLVSPVSRAVLCQQASSCHMGCMNQHAFGTSRCAVETVLSEGDQACCACGCLCPCRQVEALRLLYNEELGRASRLAVELSKATAAVDKVQGTAGSRTPCS